MAPSKRITDNEMETNETKNYNADIIETHDEENFAEGISAKNVEERRIWKYELQIPFTHLKPCRAFLQFVGNCVK